MLAELAEKLLTRGVSFAVVTAHGQVRDVLRAEGLSEKIEGITRGATIGDALAGLATERSKASTFDG